MVEICPGISMIFEAALERAQTIKSFGLHEGFLHMAKRTNTPTC